MEIFYKHSQGMETFKNIFSKKLTMKNPLDLQREIFIIISINNQYKKSHKHASNTPWP